MVPYLCCLGDLWLEICQGWETNKRACSQEEQGDFDPLQELRKYEGALTGCSEL
jgi:hypothetical protein